jgi:mersacidin/lichenicidin family type 2 lantibiotic
MQKKDIVRAWKDPEFRARLTAEERASLPANPAGLASLSDEELGQVSGGALPSPSWWDPSVWQRNGGCCKNPD